MISEICFTADWLEKKRKELGNVDPVLLERALHAFALLGHLAESGLEFVFKGGTSLLLHVPAIRRLSIDIDIICSSPVEALDRVLQQISKVAPFIDYKDDERDSGRLPKRRHFKFYFESRVPGNQAPFVLLDVVEESRIPHVVIQKPITPQLLEIRREIPVTIPTIESLLADKLTAFAPRTTGVPFEPPEGKKPELQQIVKQLFDVGELFILAENIDEIRSVYQKAFELENEYRGGGFQMRDALEDTYATSMAYCLHGLKRVPQHPDALLLEKGRKSLESHLVNHTFDLPAAKIAAAKAALLTKLIAREDANPSLAHWRTTPELEVFPTLEITGEWSRINSLRSSLSEAFWYWYQVSSLV